MDMVWKAIDELIKPDQLITFLNEQKVYKRTFMIVCI